MATWGPITTGYCATNYCKPENYCQAGVVMGVSAQADIIRMNYLGCQAFLRYYNTTQLRILCDIESRGTSTGNNWTSSPAAASGFPVSNLNNDIVEKSWRSSSNATHILTCDFEVSQGVVVDTIALLNHNFSSGVIVQVQSSSNAGFTSIVQDFYMQYTANNMYWISPTFPATTEQYWRFIITDASLSYYEVGSIVMGSAEILTGENFVDEVSFGNRDFSDSIETEGYTNVSISRAWKRWLRLDFQSLDANEVNWPMFRALFETYRTTHKCLWIPTPSATDQSITDKFAVFGKLTAIPEQTHNYKGNQHEYVTFTTEIDESK